MFHIHFNFNTVGSRRNKQLSLETFKNNITLLDMGSAGQKFYFFPHFAALIKLIGQLRVSRREKLQTEQHNGRDYLKNFQLNVSIVN